MMKKKKQPKKQPKPKTKKLHKLTILIDDDVYQSLAGSVITKGLCGGLYGICGEFCSTIVTAIKKKMETIQISKKKGSSNA